MSNLLLASDDLITAATLSVTGTPPVGMGVDNIKDPARTVKYQAASATDSKINIDLPAGSSYNMIALVDHNIPYQLIHIYFYSDSARTNEVDQISLYDANFKLDGNNIAITEFTTKTDLYITIDLGNGALVAELGVLFIGKAWRPKVNFDYGWQSYFEDRTQVSQSIGGQEYGVYYPPRRMISNQLNWLDNTDREALRQLLLKHHSLYPIIARVTDQSDELKKETTLYCSITSNTLTALRGGWHQIPLELREAL